jgi:serine O-acetyltransferase
VHSTTALIAGLVDSYARVGGINHLDGKNLPSRHVVAGLTQDLLRLLFPGFFDDRVIHSTAIQTELAAVLDHVLPELEAEIRKSLEYKPPAEVSRKDIPAYARKVAGEFIARLPELRDLLHTDTEAAYRGDPAALSREEIIVAYPFVEAIAVQRMAHELYLQHIPLLPRIMTEWAHSRTGLDLHPGATIGTHFFVDHCTGTVIGETAVLGNHVKLYQGVGLVARSLSAGRQLCGVKRHPTLEDHVTIYAGATIVGGETVIGAGSTIGANVFLMHSVPANSLVLLEEVKVRVLPKPERRAENPAQGI